MFHWWFIWNSIKELFEKKINHHVFLMAETLNCYNCCSFKKVKAVKARFNVHDLTHKAEWPWHAIAMLTSCCGVLEGTSCNLSQYSKWNDPIFHLIPLRLESNWKMYGSVMPTDEYWIRSHQVGKLFLMFCSRYRPKDQGFGRWLRCNSFQGTFPYHTHIYHI